MGLVLRALSVYQAFGTKRYFTSNYLEDTKVAAVGPAQNHNLLQQGRYPALVRPTTIVFITTQEPPPRMTLATEFAETTRRSASSAEMRKRVLHLYRKYMRYSREMSNIYELDMPVSNVKTKIRQEFERQRFVKDLEISNVLYMKGQMEFQELINFWKQQCHVMKYFENQGDTQFGDKNDFVKNFLRGN